jgi:hypothetical protein
LKFKDLKSSNSQFLGSERTVRLLGNLNSNLFKSNLQSSTNYYSSIESKLNLFGTPQTQIYDLSSLNWPDYDKHSRFFNNNIVMPTSHAPVMSNNPFFNNQSFDFFEKNTDEVTPMVLRSKEESAPSHVFNSYWLSYWSLSNFSNRMFYLNNVNNMKNVFYFPFLFSHMGDEKYSTVGSSGEYWSIN